MEGGTLSEDGKTLFGLLQSSLLWLDLTKFGYDHDKPEGVGLFPNGDLAVQDDNDFGFDQANDPQTAGPNDPPFKVTASGKTVERSPPRSH